MNVSLFLVGGLISILQGVSPEREGAIDALTDSSDAAIAQVLDTANWRGRDAAIEALERSDPPRVAYLLSLARNGRELATRRSAIRSLGRVGLAGFCDSMLVLFGSGSDAVVLDAIKGTRDCQRESIVPHLTSTDRDSRRRALQALAALDARSTVEAAVQGLNDSDHGVRAVSQRLLRDGVVDAVEEISRKYSGFSVTGKATALAVLGSIGGTRADALVTEALRAAPWSIRLAAVRALDESGGGQEALKSLMTTEKHPLVAGALKDALETIDQRTHD